MKEEKKEQTDFQEVVVQETDEPFSRAAVSDEDESPSKQIAPLAYDRKDAIF
jgi:hypothetical protein